MIYSDKRKGLYDRRIKICHSEFVPKSWDIRELGKALEEYNYEIGKHGIYSPIYNFNGTRLHPTYTLHFIKIDKDL